MAAILDETLPPALTLFELAVDAQALWEEQRHAIGMLQRGLLQPVANSYLLRGVIRALTDAGSIPVSVSAPPTAQPR